MPPLTLEGKSLAVLGAGREGTALVRWLLSQGLTVTVCDREDQSSLGRAYTELNQPGVAWRLGKDYLKNLKDFEVIFRSPGIPYFSPEIQQAKKAGVIVSSQTKLFFERCPSPIVGITGTKGKGTTSKLLHLMLTAAGRPAQLGGNIGRPPIEFLDQLSGKDVVVLELSSFQLQDLEQSPGLAVITNLTVDHLDHHRNIEEYHRAKSSIVRFQGADNLAIFNADDRGSKELSSQAGGRQQWFSHLRDVTPGASARDGQVVLEVEDKQVPVCDIADIPIPGPHNLDDVLAACLAVYDLGVKPAIMKQTIRAFPGLEHHLELVAEKNGLTFVNDSYATNPTATTPAIESFSQPIILICGGADKGLSYRELAEVIVQHPVKALVLIEPVGRTIAEDVTMAAAALNRPVPVMKIIRRKEEIVPKARALAKKGDVIMFSPATASFGMFANYQERGTFFKEQVLRA